MIKLEKEKIMKNLVKYTAKVFIAALASNCIHIKITHVVPEKIELDHATTRGSVDVTHHARYLEIHHSSGAYGFTVNNR